MNNFSDFMNKNDDEKKVNSTSNKESKYTSDQLQDMINKYSGFSKDKLMSEFIKLTLEKKKRGELSDSELENIKSTISPMLNLEQKESLEKLLDMVKNV